MANMPIHQTRTEGQIYSGDFYIRNSQLSKKRLLCTVYREEDDVNSIKEKQREVYKKEPLNTRDILQNPLNTSPQEKTST